MSVRSPFVDIVIGFDSFPSRASTLITFGSSFESVDSRISLRTFSLLCFPLTSSAKSDVSFILIDFFGTTFASSEGEGDFEGVLRTEGEGDRWYRGGDRVRWLRFRGGVDDDLKLLKI